MIKKRFAYLIKALVLTHFMFISDAVLSQEKKYEMATPPPKTAKKPNYEVEASYPGGPDSAVVWINENLSRFPVAYKFFKSRQLTETYFYFSIKEDGTPQYRSCIHELTDGVKNELWKLISEMPSWNPARLDGANVAMRKSLLVKFTFTE